LLGQKAQLNSMLLAIFTLLSGCSSAVTPHFSPETSKSSLSLQATSDSAFAGRWEVEVESVEQQALNAISSMPAQFLIDFSENFYAWERAQVYFDLYTTERTVLTDPESGSEVVSNQNSRDDNFWYSVKRSPTNEGFLYRVLVTPRQPGEASRTAASINAKNLGRFIRDGILERSFVKR